MIVINYMYIIRSNLVSCHSGPSAKKTPMAFEKMSGRVCLHFNIGSKKAPLCTESLSIHTYFMITKVILTDSDICLHVETWFQSHRDWPQKECCDLLWDSLPWTSHGEDQRLGDRRFGTSAESCIIQRSECIRWTCFLQNSILP